MARSPKRLSHRVTSQVGWLVASAMPRARCLAALRATARLAHAFTSRGGGNFKRHRSLLGIACGEGLCARRVGFDQATASGGGGACSTSLEPGRAVTLSDAVRAAEGLPYASNNLQRHELPSRTACAHDISSSSLMMMFMMMMMMMVMMLVLVMVLAMVMNGQR